MEFGVTSQSMRVQIHRFPVSNWCNKNLESNHQVNKQTLHISPVRISQKVKGEILLSTYYFHMKTNRLVDFQICISVPMNNNDYQMR